MLTSRKLRAFSAPTPPYMSYPGNATLTREMQDRILSTFKQTLTAAAAGNRQEATLGCDFILRLDSLFEPARELLQRMEAGEGPVQIDDLATMIGETPAEPPVAAESPAAAAAPPPVDPAAAAAVVQPPEIDDLSDLDLEMGLSDPATSPPEPIQPEPVQPAPTPAAPEPPPTAAPPATAAPEPPLAAPAEPMTPPAEPPPQAVDTLDDLDLGMGDDFAAQALPPEPMPLEPQAAAPEAPEPVAPEPVVTEPPAPEPVFHEPPPVEPPVLETPTGEASAAAPPPEAPFEDPLAMEPPPSEAPQAEAMAPEPELPEIPESQKAEPQATTEPADAPPADDELSGLDELDDLDLSVGADVPAEPPPPAEEIAEPQPVDEPQPAITDPEAPVAEPGPAEPEPAEAPAPTSPPESVEIPLGTEPAAQLDSESQQRIDDLMAEGQQAFDDGEYQGAIDAWSRVFLIDIDHAEANKRIEEARKLKAEADRKVEEKFHEGLAHLESGETEPAAESFRQVLAMNSSHLQARDYLEKLEAGEVPIPAELSRPTDPDLMDVEPDGSDLEAPEEGDEESKPRPDRGSQPVGESMVAVKKSPFKSKSFLAIAALGLIAVLAGGWYLFTNWSSLFPNSAADAPTPTAQDPVARAKGLHDSGKTPIAIAQLRRLPPDNPQYDEAQTLIAQWELEQTPADAGPEGPSPQEVARRETLVAEAEAAAGRREFMLSSKLLSEAAVITPLSGAEVQLLARADEQLQELQNFITLFREGEWDLALRDLWLLHESDPGNRDVTRLLVDSYYNLGLRSLQRNDLKMASEQFKEALVLSPDDPELLRLAHFANTYQSRSTDLLYRIYVKYHPFR